MPERQNKARFGDQSHEPQTDQAQTVREPSFILNGDGFEVE
jgi:hypothetical protein